MTDPKIILILDDWISLRKLLCRFLDRRGFFSVGVGTVDEAEATLNQVQVDLAILDFQLAEGTSEPLFEILYDRGIPFVIHTGDPISAREAASDLPMEIWEKGLSGKEIGRRVGEILG